jgi:rubrerythrin
MKPLKGSKTEKNILTAFAGESQARNRYTYFASKAKKEGYEQISAVFTETADQEKEHAKRLFKYLEGGEVEFTAAFPAGTIGDTLANLREAAGGEAYEEDDMYPSFAAVAKEEGYAEVAATFQHIAKAEGFHKQRYAKLADNIEQGLVFRRPSKTLWRCRNCGYPMESDHAPEKCPACEHPQAYFEIAPENW